MKETLIDILLFFGLYKPKLQPGDVYTLAFLKEPKSARHLIAIENGRYLWSYNPDGRIIFESNIAFTDCYLEYWIVK